ncbi:hypothetical protein GRI97_06750 [Altererythrobacter xixiisoli]|uniref:Uncharacterized protein n=1 Tax=Croceibacterium xixiisoli TaxID=1476466 RepID=A0A6I4TU44_9SPHN|nr:hypothetical protein [Croceibacterium xixiisoli]MXO98681.1 hypothetical protein [Croceibacterium xixiisoli]
MLTVVLSILFGVAAFISGAVILQSAALGLRYWKAISAQMERERISSRPARVTRAPLGARSPVRRIVRQQAINREPAPLFAV